jgi:signal transduction histidine kinase
VRVHPLFDQVLLGPRSLPPLCGGCVGMALALFLALKPGEARTRTWFAIIAFCSTIWSWAAALTLGARTPELASWLTRISYAGIALAGPCALSFGAELARVRTRWQWPAHVAAIVGALAILFVPSLTTVHPRPGGGYWPGPSWSLFVATLASGPPLLAGMQLVRRAWRRLPPCRHRRQLAWAWAALLLGALGALDLQTVVTGAYPTAWLTSMLSSVTLFYAIAQHRLMATRTFIRQALIGAVGLCAGGLVIAALISVAPRLFAHGGMGLLVTTLGLFVAVRLWTSAVEPSLTYLFGWRRRRIDRAFVEFERRSLEARSTDEVALCLADALRDAFDARLVRLLPADRARDDEHPSVGVAETALAESGAPLLRDLVELDDARAPRLLDALDRLGADALLPLMRDKQLQAMVAIAGDALSPADDLVADELRRMGQRAALAWVNARLYHEVALRSAGLETQVRLRTAELEQALGELRSAHARLVEVERSSSLGLLVAGISHEINNALNIIHANLPTLARYAQRYDELAGDGDDTDLQIARQLWPRAIVELGDSVRRTRAIVDDLRKFARPDTERRLVRVQEGLDAALNLLRRRTDGRLDIARVYAGTPSVDGYPGQLNQCFFNLLLNAVEAARSEIWVVLAQRDEAGGVSLIINDDGDGGGEPDDEERLFSPVMTPRERQSSLGLTVSRSIVQRHGGTLEVARAAGAGVTVRLTLPPSAPAPAPAAPKDPA